MWYEDLTPCDYFSRYETALTAIGWLENRKDFSKGSAPKDFYYKLKEFNEVCWSFSSHRGYHQCDLCQFQFEHESIVGISNIFIPHNGKIYVCPELITHYVNAHYYLPPREFVEAFYLYPPMRSMEYLKKIVENGGRKLVKLMKE